MHPQPEMHSYVFRSLTYAIGLAAAYQIAHEELCGYNTHGAYGEACWSGRNEPRRWQYPVDGASAYIQAATQAEIKPDTHEGIFAFLDSTSDVDSIAPGDKVRYTFPDNGYDGDRELAVRSLELGKVYTVEGIDRGGWITHYSLLEIPHGWFNSVHFEDCE